MAGSVLLRLELVIDYGSDEGREEHIAFEFTGFGIYGSLRVRAIPVQARQLILESLLPGGKFLELLGRRVVVRIRRPKDALYRCSCLAEVLVITAFAGCLRGFVEVTGVSDVVHFLFAFGDDFTVGSAENLAPVDGSVLLYSAMDFDERVIINRFSHNSDILVKNYTLCLYDSHQ